MQRQGTSYDDVIAFLKRVEDPKGARMNRRTPIPPQKASALRKQFPGIPEDYVAYLREVGWGSFRECQFMVYGSLGTPDEILGAGVFDWLKPKDLCFGDNFSGDLVGFVPDKKWALVELWHDAGRVQPVKQTFGQFIRERMFIGENGEDLRGA